MNATGALGIEVFEWVLRTTWHAAVLAGLILLAQLLFRKHLSPGWRYGLWLLLVVRLLIPVTPRSATSIFNLASLNPPRMGSGTAPSGLLSSASLFATTDPPEKRRPAALDGADPLASRGTTSRGDLRATMDRPGHGLGRDRWAAGLELHFASGLWVRAFLDCALFGPTRGSVRAWRVMCPPPTKWRGGFWTTV